MLSALGNAATGLIGGKFNRSLAKSGSTAGKGVKGGFKSLNMGALRRAGGGAEVAFKGQKKFNLMDKKLRMRLRKKFEEENNQLLQK